MVSFQQQIASFIALSLVFFFSLSLSLCIIYIYIYEEYCVSFQPNFVSLDHVVFKTHGDLGIPNYDRNPIMIIPEH